jgi:hypothetical protein
VSAGWTSVSVFLLVEQHNLINPSRTKVGNGNGASVNFLAVAPEKINPMGIRN